MGKKEAFKFLSRLEEHLRTQLDEWSAVHRRVLSISDAAKNDPEQSHKRGPEQAFLNHYGLPEIHNFLKQQPYMDSSIARNALLSENVKGMGEYASASPSRSEDHPFTKKLGIRANKIYQKWLGNEPGKELAQSCPDIAISNPHKVLFEGKYFFGNKSIETASRELVEDLYQAFFYLGMPSVPSKGAKPSWDYDYACLLAFDASTQGTLLEAWKALPSHVRKGFWGGANIYVMILR
jgi:hypothetical protein